MERALPFTKEHEMFREAFGKFLDKEAVPYYDEWSEKHMIDHKYYEKMGELGYLCMWMDERYGGAGCKGDYLYTVIKAEEYAKRGLNCIFSRLHGDVVAPYIYAHGTEEQKMKWLPQIAKGKTILAVCMTEPNHGSDLASIETKAVKNGDDYIINGSKVFISNGSIADLLVVAVRTDPDIRPLHRGVSLVLIETDRPGVTRRIIPRIGLQAQDTSEIFFDNVRIPQSNLLGEEGTGFKMLMQHLEAERIMAAYGSIGTVEYTLALTKEYVKKREMFGTTLSSYQNTQFKLVELETEYRLALNFLDQVLINFMAGKKDIGADVSMIKYYCSELAFRAADRCVQMFGGYGICQEYPIAKQFCDARIMRFMGGTTETQMSVVAKALGIK
ncbi:MAG TPA: acyl-CoA dehydrogenase [Lachnospiraceae bacterium]|jgi:acyl-CoA dehydrogenase|nr:acyl-CoA dehydrogenase [Lachnospiraceae bacterium]